MSRRDYCMKSKWCLEPQHLLASEYSREHDFFPSATPVIAQITMVRPSVLCPSPLVWLTPYAERTLGDNVKGGRRPSSVVNCPRPSPLSTGAYCNVYILLHGTEPFSESNCIWSVSVCYGPGHQQLSIITLQTFTDAVFAFAIGALRTSSVYDYGTTS